MAGKWIYLVFDGRIDIKSMKLVLILVLAATVASYRHLATKNLPLSTTPDSIYYLSSKLLVTRLGREIDVYNTTRLDVPNPVPVQKFIADSDEPDIQVAPQENKVLFKFNNSIIQLQDAKEASETTQPTEEINWVYRMGATGSILLTHQMSRLGGERLINYLDTDNQVTKSFNYSVPEQNVIAGSNVEALSPEQYYFASGGFCDGSAEKSQFYLFSGNSEGIKRIYNAPVPGCSLTWDEQHKQEWILASRKASTNEGNDRVHALTYVLDEDNRPRDYTTQIIKRTNGLTSEQSRFDTKRLIGIEYLNEQLYTADDLLCRITEQVTDNYRVDKDYDSAMPADTISTSVERNTEEWVVGLTNSKTCYLVHNNFDRTFSLTRTFDNPSGETPVSAHFDKDLNIVLRSASGKLSVYDPIANKGYNTTYLAVAHFCVTEDGSSMFALPSGNPQSLRALQLNPTTKDISERPNGVLGLTYSVAQLLCLGSNSVLVNTADSKSIMQIIAYQGGLTEKAKRVKEDKVNFQAFKTQSLIYFTNVDRKTTPKFYDANSFNEVIISTKLALAPTNQYQWVSTGTDDLMLAVSDDLTELAAIDHYRVVGTTLTYQGTFPLVRNGLGAPGRVIVLPKQRYVSISYGADATTYSFDNPPQRMQGLFYDIVDQDCNLYHNALFRINPFTKNKEMIVINPLSSTPVLERYIFGQQPTKATLFSSSPLKNFISTKLAIELSADGLEVLVKGVKMTMQTLRDAIQIRSSTNLADITFEKIYFDELDPSDIQSFILLNNNVYAAVVSTDLNDTSNHYVTIRNDPNSGGAISTGVGNVVLYQSCIQCNFILVVGSEDLTKLYKVNINSGEQIAVIDLKCEARMMSTNLDGTLVAYFCTDNRLLVHNTQTGATYNQNYSSADVTKLTILGANSLVVIIDGVIVQRSIKYDQPLTGKNPVITTTSTLFQEPTTQEEIPEMVPELKAYTQGVVVNYQDGVYATSTDGQTINIYNFDGTASDPFPLEPEQSLQSMSFVPNSSPGQLVLLTTDNKIITLTAQGCSQNSTLSNGYCTCQETFVGFGDNCQCSAFLHYEEGKCVCNDGSFYVSSTQCEDCSAFCSTCSQGGISGCQSYSALFIIMIILIILAAAAIGIFAFWYIKKRKAGDKHKVNDSKESSEYEGAKEPLVEAEQKS